MGRSLESANEEFARHAHLAEQTDDAGVLAVLAQDASFGVRYRVARNPHCPVDVLAVLAEDEADVVVAGVAGNPAAPAELLEKVASGSYELLRSHLASNPATPEHLMCQLVVEDDAGVRATLAHNPAATRHVLEMLAEDSHPQVRRAAFETLGLPRMGDLPPGAWPVWQKIKSVTWSAGDGILALAERQLAAMEPAQMAALQRILGEDGPTNRAAASARAIVSTYASAGVTVADLVEAAHLVADLPEDFIEAAHALIAEQRQDPLGAARAARRLCDARI